MRWSSEVVLVGIDWGRQEHAVCVLDSDGAVLSEWTIEHSGAALVRLTDRLAELAGGDVGRVHVAVELTRGSLVETLIEHGFHVYALNPKQSDRYRDRHFPAGSKDDRRDAFVAADALRTDAHKLRELRVDDPVTIQLREHVRMHENLREDENRITNRLRDQLLRHFPQLVGFNASISDPWMLELIEIAPTPELARAMKAGDIAKLLRKHRIRKFSVDDVLAMLRDRDVFVVAGTTQAAAAHIRLLVPQLRLVQEQQRQVDRELTGILEQLSVPSAKEDESSPERVEHRDAEILLSLPGAGTIVVATMLAEASSAIRERDYPALRALSGVAPVTKASGTRKCRYATVKMRKARDHLLANALYHFARVASQVDPAAKAHYASLRGRGHSHGRALRGVGDRLLDVAVAMLRSGTVYDQTKRRPAPPADRIVA
jgi:transposase